MWLRQSLREAGLHRFRVAFPFVVLAVGLMATALIASYVNTTAAEKDRNRFDNQADDLQNAVATRIDTYVALLRAGAGLFAGSREVTREEFHVFVDRLDLRGRYPGIQGIGYAPRIPAARLDQAIADVRADGLPDFLVRPEHARPDYFPIVYLEPPDRRNLVAIGYDMFTEPVRRQAMERAARRATTSASGKVTLVQEIDSEKQPGFLIYVPTYTTGLPPAAEAERLEALEGFIYSPFRAGDFVRAVLGREDDPLFHLRVYDGEQEHHGALLFETAGSEDVAPNSLRRRVTLDVAGRPWLLTFTSRAGFRAVSDTRLLPWIVAVGAGASLLLFLLTFVEGRARAQAERAAVDLGRSEEALRAGQAELRRLVDAERRAHAEAAAANRAKDEFLATMSHELRTPLNAILGWATILKSGHHDAAQQAHALEVIIRNARTQADLIEDLLDVSRVIMGKLQIEMRPILLSPAIRTALDAVGPAAAAKGVTLEWRQTTDGPVLGDPDRLQQVAWNLLTNSIKFTPQGGKVVASLDRVGPTVEFRVTDNGIGIPEGYLPDLFERFRQRDSSTTRKHGGMGLGLAIVRHLVEAHGGTVRAESPGEGRGSTFFVTLPVRETAPCDDPVALAPDPGSVREHLAAVHALVVEDDADSREVLAGVLAQAGARVRTAASTAEALAALEADRFGVLIADIGMPDADGYELVRRVRAHPVPHVRQLPAIAVTAYARATDRHAAEAAGFQLHVAKPIDVHLLIDAVGRLTRPPDPGSA